MQLLRAALQSNPELIQPLLEQLAASNPQIANLIQQDPEAFIRMFLSGAPGSGNDLDLNLKMKVVKLVLAVLLLLLLVKMNKVLFVFN